MLLHIRQDWNVLDLLHNPLPDSPLKNVLLKDDFDRLDTFLPHISSKAGNSALCSAFHRWIPKLEGHQRDQQRSKPCFSPPWPNHRAIASHKTAPLRPTTRMAAGECSSPLCTFEHGREDCPRRVHTCGPVTDEKC